ncbi:DUF6268 family outer membrane beta-barrel protein [Parashewanella tropica]|uniref:DUF6268 family outer membrane beta-barrel protein n=1 Tax=Parashewanella tropica TaxID=2547970 RepID=UPI0010595075|nr:DUF6268 family outer membrane beta-barrel protein [Parashewanella tropica]
MNTKASAILLSAVVGVSLPAFADDMPAPASSGEQPSFGPSTSISITGVLPSTTEIKANAAKFDREKFRVDFSTQIPLNQSWVISASAGYEEENFDWKNIKNNVVPNSTIRPWDKLKSVEASVTLMHFYDQNWSFMLTPMIKAAYQDNYKASDAWRYGLVAGAMYRYESGNTLGFGLMYTNGVKGVNEVKAMPYVIVDWKLSDKLSVRNPFKNTFSGPAGIELAYDYSNNLTFSVGSAMRRNLFLAAGKDTKGEIEEIATFIATEWNISKSFTARGYLGYLSNGTLEFDNQNVKYDLDATAAAAFNLEYSF